MAGDRPRLLLFGASGQVGRALSTALAPLASVTTLDRAAADFARPESLRDVVLRHQPTIVAIAAAFTAVDRAEDERDLAHRVNAVAPGVIASAAQAAGACVVHYSSDYVYNGRKLEPYLESDAADPRSVYAKTKLAGDLAVAGGCARHIILRTSWVFSGKEPNFLLTILRRAREGATLRVVNDQVGAPTSAELIGQVTAAMLRVMHTAPASDARWGVYHLAAGGFTSWFDYARHIIAKGRALGLPLKLESDAVRPVSTAEFGARAERPANSRLNTGRLRSTFAVDLPPWTAGVDRLLEQLRAA